MYTLKNRGITKTEFIVNGHKKNNKLEWNVDYDGKKADVCLGTMNNGHKQKYKARLDNKALAKLLNTNDLANILNMPAQETSLEERLTNDFLMNRPMQQSLQQPLLLQPPPAQTTILYIPNKRTRQRRRHTPRHTPRYTPRHTPRYTPRHTPRHYTQRHSPNNHTVHKLLRRRLRKHQLLKYTKRKYIK